MRASTSAVGVLVVLALSGCTDPSPTQPKEPSLSAPPSASSGTMGEDPEFATTVEPEAVEPSSVKVNAKVVAEWARTYPEIEAMRERARKIGGVPTMCQPGKLTWVQVTGLDNDDKPDEAHLGVIDTKGVARVCDTRSAVVVFDLDTGEASRGDNYLQQIRN